MEHVKVQRRDDNFASKISTRIWKEIPDDSNPYIAAAVKCHGYDVLEMMGARSFIDILYLMFKGDLPNKNEAELLEKLMIALINPGPRHPAVRAAMYSAVSKTQVSHILPIGLNILSGLYLGAGNIDHCMRFFRKHIKLDPQMIAEKFLLEIRQDETELGHVAPGFGSEFGGIDKFTMKIANQLLATEAAGEALHWGQAFSKQLITNNAGWLKTGIAAAVFTDLGFQPRAGIGLFQLISAPGILAHGLEMANKPLTSMPFPNDENYTIE